jgi:Receptor L domain
MKNRILKFRFIAAFVGFFFCALINTNGFAQCTTPSTLSGKTFRSQAEINQFASDYAHLGCVFITGNVVIQGYDIVSLAGLGVISQIQGFLLIDRTGLTSLNGLQNLTSVGGNLNVFANPYLVTLVGLTGVTNISGTLEIRDNPLLTHMMYGSGTGLIVVTPLTHVNDVIIRNNPRLLNLQGLAYLTSINGALLIADCPVLTSLQGLNNLNNVGGLTIEGLTALTDLHGLEAIQTVVGGLRIAGNYNITSLRGLTTFL